MALKSTTKATPMRLRKQKADLVIPDSGSPIPDWDSSVMFAQPRTPIRYPPDRTPDPPSSIPCGQRTPILSPSDRTLDPPHSIACGQRHDIPYFRFQDGRSHENKDKQREGKKRKGTRREPRWSGEGMSQTRAQDDEEEEEEEEEKDSDRETKKQRMDRRRQRCEHRKRGSEKAGEQRVRGVSFPDEDKTIHIHHHHIVKNFRAHEQNFFGSSP